jgi:superfamily II DNA or RNA helicase
MVDNIYHVFLVPDDVYIYLPWRYILKHKLYAPDPIELGINTDELFTGTLRGEQSQYACETVEVLRSHRTALLSLKTGGGKTVVAIYIMCMLQLPVTILVHRNVLVEQWKARIQQFAPCAPFHIKVLNVASIKPDQLEYNETPTLLVIDEAHLFCTDRCTTILLKYPCTHSLALTATVERKDQRHRLLYRIYGLPVVTTRVHQDFTVLLVDTAYMFNLIFTKSKGARTVKWVDMIREQSQCEDRNRHIVQWVHALVRRNYKVLVLSKFVEHCDTIVQYMSIDTAVHTVGVHGTRDMDMSDTSWQCIVGTYSKCSTGFDVPINALVLASDTVGTFEQTMGRIFRTHMPPVIIDLVDRGYDHSVWQKHADERKQFYVQCGGTILECRQDAVLDHICTL